MKDIVIIANFCRDFSADDNGRFIYLCKKLSQNNNVEIITSDFYHSAKKHRKPLEKQWPFKITFLNEPGYGKNISIKRFYSHFIWGKNVKKYLKDRKKPDVIYCAVPSLTGPLLTSKFCKKNNIRFIVDIQDLWPEAFKMVFNIPIISNIIFFPFKIIAQEIYINADDICAVSNTYTERAKFVNKKCQNGHTVFLGTDLNRFDKNSNQKSKYKKSKKELWLGYCGSLEASYDICYVIDALCHLKNIETDCVTFIIMGDGSKKEIFQSYAEENNVSTIFTGKLPYNDMCAVLTECDFVVNPITESSAASIINKHADYAASGLPVLNTQDSKEYRKLVDIYNMGFNCNGRDPRDLAEKLQTLVKNESLRKEMGINARKCAVQKFDRATSYDELISCILK